MMFGTAPSPVDFLWFCFSLMLNAELSMTIRPQYEENVQIYLRLFILQCRGEVLIMQLINLNN